MANPIVANTHITIPEHHLPVQNRIASNGLLLDWTLSVNGSRGRTRTDKTLRSGDFESPAFAISPHGHLNVKPRQEPETSRKAEGLPQSFQGLLRPAQTQGSGEL